MCLLGLLGVILMVIENEIDFCITNRQDTMVNWLMKLITTISTIVLVSLVIVFHYFYLKLYATQNSLDHWRIGLTMKRIFLIIFEILICAIHPIPHSYITIDVALSLPSKDIRCSFFIIIRNYFFLIVFARFYLIYRCIVFRSHLRRDAPSKSFGSFNQVSINFIFLMKTYLEQWPARCLILSCCTIFFIGSWSIRACGHISTDSEHRSLLDSMWLFIITFTTVGKYLQEFLFSKQKKNKLHCEFLFRLWRYKTLRNLWTKYVG